MSESLFNKVTVLVSNFIKKETLAQVSSCESCKISKYDFTYRTPLVAASSLVQPITKVFSLSLGGVYNWHSSKVASTTENTASHQVIWRLKTTCET